MSARGDSAKQRNIFMYVLLSNERFSFWVGGVKSGKIFYDLLIVQSSSAVPRQALFELVVSAQSFACS
jgi:hypothetical protein